jgi:peptidoglycan hydrolase-like protein with peptidoglycan-binding domain
MTAGRARAPIALAGMTIGLVLVASSCGTPPAGGQTVPIPTASPGTVGTPASTATQATSATPMPSPTPLATASKLATPESAKPAKPAALLSRGDSGEKVRELQHRLLQLEWYSGPITGRYAKSTGNGVAGFQEKRKLKATGEVDKRTWDRLVEMTATPTRDQMHNVLRAGPAILRQGSTGEQVRELQARLKQIGWYSGNVTDYYGSVTTSTIRSFQVKRHIPVTGEVDQRTWDRLVAMTREPTRNEKHNIAAKPASTGLDPRCLTGRAMCVSKSTNSLVWVIDGQPQLRVDVRFGSQELPTREGAFSVGWKSRDHVSTIYHTPMPYAMFFSGGQAVHYSPDFAARGYNGASHGCVNVRDLQAIQWLFSTVRVGDKVIVYR